MLWRSQQYEGCLADRVDARPGILGDQSTRGFASVSRRFARPAAWGAAFLRPIFHYSHFLRNLSQNTSYTGTKGKRSTSGSLDSLQAPSGGWESVRAGPLVRRLFNFVRTQATSGDLQGAEEICPAERI